jgi:hypothetical protein
MKQSNKPKFYIRTKMNVKTENMFYYAANFLNVAAFLFFRDLYSLDSW